MNKKITIQPGQTLFDVAVEHYGMVDAVSILLADNPHLADITSTDLAGTEVIIQGPVPALSITNKRTVESFFLNAYSPATLYPNS